MTVDICTPYVEPTQGELFFTKVDQMDNNASIQINKPGDPANNFNEFEQGIDFHEGRDQNHEIVYSKLKL